MHFLVKKGKTYVSTDDLFDWFAELQEIHKTRGQEEIAEWIAIHKGDFALTIMNAYK